MDEVQRPEGRGIQGFTGKDFKSAREVMGEDFNPAEMPEGVKYYLKEKSYDIAKRNGVVNVYRLVEEGTKDRRSWVGEFGNRVPDEKEIAERFGPGRYIWIAKWKTHDDKEPGIMSDPFIIDESAQVLHEAYLQKQKPAAMPAPAAIPQAAPAAPVFGLEGILKLMEATEEKTLARMERMAAMFKGNDTPAEILKSTYQASVAMMKEATDMNVSAFRSINKKAKDEMNSEGQDGEGEAEEKPESMSSVIKTFLPELKPYLEKLIGGGPAGAVVKSFVLGTEQWKEIFQDKEKFGVAVAAMEQEFGSDKTEKALDILLNRRPPVNAKGKRKGEIKKPRTR